MPEQRAPPHTTLHDRTAGLTARSHSQNHSRRRRHRLFGYTVRRRGPATGAAQRLPVHLSSQIRRLGRGRRVEEKTPARSQDHRSRRVRPARGAATRPAPRPTKTTKLPPTPARSLPRVTTTVAGAGWAARRGGSTCAGGWPSPSSISGRSLSMLLRQGTSTTWSMRSSESTMPSSKRPHRATRSWRTTSTAHRAHPSAPAPGLSNSSINKVVRAVHAVLQDAVRHGIIERPFLGPRDARS